MMLVLLAVPAENLIAQDGRDVGVTVSNTTNGFAFTGSHFDYFFRVEHVGSANQVLFPTGSVVFRVDLPVDATYEAVRLGSGGLFGGELDCSLTMNTVTCLSENDFRFINNNGFRNVVVEGAVPQVSGPLTLPEPGGECVVDPDDVVVEEDETNNTCGPDVIEVSDPPELKNTAWMGVTMWDNVMRVYDHELDQQLSAAPVNMVDGVELHAINDIATNPTNDTLYVFHREYESASMRLGTIDPATGVTDIGDTGNSFHDSAFATDGTLYAVGRDGLLYTVDTATAASTALCTTPYGSPINLHSALAWNPDTDELVVAANRELRTIDLDNLPVDPADPCPATIDPLPSNLNDAFFAAYFEDGFLFLVEDVGRFYVAGSNGELLQLGTLPMPMHGMVPDDGTLPSIEPSCNPDGWIFAAPSQSVLATEVWEVNIDDGSLAWVTTLFEFADSVDYEPASNSIVMLNSGRTRTRKYDPCTGEFIVEGDVITGTSGLRSLDIGPANVVHTGRLFTGELFELDLATGILTSLGDTVDEFNALAIVGDEVIVDVSVDTRGGSTATTDELKRYSLSGWPNLISTDALTYGDGFEFSSDRRIWSFDPNPIDGTLLTVVSRVPEFGSINSDASLPNVLALIDGQNNVTKVRNLPASFRTAIWFSNSFLKDGFESTVLQVD